MIQRKPTLHLARPEDAPLEVRRLAFESDWHYTQRVRAIHALGVRWVRHPDYRFLPLHSYNEVIWKAAHAIFWQQVLDAARGIRERNAAFQRAQAVRKATEGS